MKLFPLPLCGLALLGPFACAQNAVTVYGVVDLALMSDSNSGQSLMAVNSGQQTASRLGFKGTEALGGGRYDLVLSDKNIFRYFTLQLKLNKSFNPKPVVEHSFVKFNPMDYRPVFRDRKVRDDFNAGLKHLQDSGRVNAIYQKYLGDGKGG